MRERKLSNTKSIISMRSICRDQPSPSIPPTTISFTLIKDEITLAVQYSYKHYSFIHADLHQPDARWCRGQGLNKGRLRLPKLVSNVSFSLRPRVPHLQRRRTFCWWPPQPQHHHSTELGLPATFSTIITLNIKLN
jgi:hypothetical protein